MQNLAKRFHAEKICMNTYINGHLFFPVYQKEDGQEIQDSVSSGMNTFSLLKHPTLLRPG